MGKKILLVIKSPLHGGGRAAEGLRMATAMIAMDVLPSILLIDDGVYCLLRNQKPEVAGLTPFEDRLKALADLVGLYTVSDSIRQRKLENSDLNPDYNVKTLSIQEAAMLVSQNETTITF